MHARLKSTLEPLLTGLLLSAAANAQVRVPKFFPSLPHTASLAPEVASDVSKKGYHVAQIKRSGTYLITDGAGLGGAGRARRRSRGGGARPAVEAGRTPRAHPPSARTTSSAVSLPEKFCCPVTRFPSPASQPRRQASRALDEIFPQAFRGGPEHDVGAGGPHEPETARDLRRATARRSSRAASYRFSLRVESNTLKTA